MRSKMTTLVPKKLIDISNDMEGVDDSDDDQEDLTERQRKDAKIEAFEAIRESDSIQRAMTDIHRRSKLLSNFAIMNATGFIKIVKKFDKSFPLRKGMMKDVNKKGFICDDGNGIATLSDKMVSDIHQTCFNNITAKKVQLRLTFVVLLFAFQEKLFAKWFCDGNITEARSVLLPKIGDGLDMDWSQLR